MGTWQALWMRDISDIFIPRLSIKKPRLLGRGVGGGDGVVVDG